jgi:peroxiredoxin
VDIAEERDRVKAFVDDQGLTFAVLLDEKANAAKQYQVRNIPNSFFINHQGVIQTQHTGPLSESIIQGYIEELLQ